MQPVIRKAAWRCAPALVLWSTLSGSLCAQNYLAGQTGSQLPGARLFTVGLFAQYTSRALPYAVGNGGFASSSQRYLGGANASFGWSHIFPSSVVSIDYDITGIFRPEIDRGSVLSHNGGISY